PAARCHYLLDLLAQVPGPRARRGRGHSLAGLLAVGTAAVIAGSRSFAAIGQWAADAGPDVLASLGAARGPAEESTFRRAFALVSADVLGQVAVDEKSNEIPAVRELLKAFADLAGVVLAIDALRTQHDTAQLILGRGADYVMTVKANMPTMYKQLKKLPWAAMPAVSSVSKDHGRRARRTVKVALAPAWTGFEGAAQVARLRRTVVKKGKKTVEVVYLITSDHSATPEILAAWVRQHWHIENKLHWVRDVTYQEDESLVRTGDATRVMATLRSVAISILRLDSQANIAAANRHHARDPQRTLKLLQAA
ncbi:MAG TPA: ISAs1 family transposase, partial [Trebonia sp.]